MFFGTVQNLAQCDVSIYRNSQAATTNNRYSIWVKPANCKWVWIECIGAGGGGGGGFSAAAGSNRGGGGGGGAGSYTMGLWPARMVPSALYVYVGDGGAGGAAGSGGTAGAITRVGLRAANSLSTNELFTSATGGNGGGAGAGSGTASAGTGGAALTNTGAHGQFIGVIASRIGQSGSTGGIATGAAGSSITLSAGAMSFGGCGGGGTPIANTDFAGGGYTALGNSPFNSTICSGVGGASGGGRGADGFFVCFNNTQLQLAGFPVNSELWGFSFGGTGGGTNGAAGTGGDGGKGGGYGSGGGGGGGGVTGGAGGRGAAGRVIIIAGY